MFKNIKWANKELPGLSHDELNELTYQQLTRSENGKQTIEKNSSYEARSKGGQTNRDSGHISNLGKHWGPINALKGGTTQEVRLMGAKAMKEKSSITIQQLSIDGELIKEWNSINDAKRAGYVASSISRCCNNKTKSKSHRGFIWKFKDS
jgi:hypothetical protein